MDYFTDKIKLYHGSKSGIKGKIRPKSRNHCDFDSGFYLGDKPEQPKGLISAKKFEDSKFYTFELDKAKLAVYEFTDPLIWALYIAYNRGAFIDCPKRLKKNFDMISDHDVIIGPIADDSMTPILDEFFNNSITDKVLIEALSYVKLGNQYVLKTQKACDSLKLLSTESLSMKDRNHFNNELNTRNRTMGEVIRKLRIKYLRSGKYFIEIVGEYK